MDEKKPNQDACPGYKYARWMMMIMMRWDESVQYEREIRAAVSTSDSTDEREKIIFKMRPSLPPPKGRIQGVKRQNKKKKQKTECQEESWTQETPIFQVFFW